MAEAVIMPKQGQSVEACIITEWFKNVGDSVSEGDLLFAYETDKASFEEEAKLSGTLLTRFYEEGDEVPVLLNVAVIGSEGDDISSFSSNGETKKIENDKEKTATKEVVEEKQVSADAPAPIQNTNGEIFISPRAKKLADANAIQVGELNGGGPKGRIIERDVEAFLQSHPTKTSLAKAKAANEQLSSPTEGSAIGGRVSASDFDNSTFGKEGDYKIEKLPNIRKLIAKAMHNSLQNSAQLTHHLGADARNILALRKNAKAAMADGLDVNITLNDMICFATIKALQQFPNVNSHFLGEEMRLFNNVHLGLAVDTDRGLMVPSIRNASDLSIKGLARQMKKVAEDCRAGNIDPDLLNPEAASFTVSNLGNYGVEMFTPIINLPQSAILGVNTIVPRPKDLGNGAYGFVPYLGLSLTYDHRSIDGGEATRFVKQVAIEIENLEFEL